MMKNITIKEYPSKDYFCYQNIALLFNIGNIEGEEVIASVKVLPRYSERFGVKSNVLFIDNTKSPEDFNYNHKFHMEKMKPGPMGDMLIDKLWRRYNKKEVMIFNYYLDKLIETVKKENSYFYQFLEEAGIFTRTFSRYAGCSMCACSPGFKMKNVSNNVKNMSVHVNFETKKKS